MFLPCLQSNDGRLKRFASMNLRLICPSICQLPIFQPHIAHLLNNPIASIEDLCCVSIPSLEVFVPGKPALNHKQPSQQLKEFEEGELAKICGDQPLKHQGKLNAMAGRTQYKLEDGIAFVLSPSKNMSLSSTTSMGRWGHKK